MTEIEGAPPWGQRVVEAFGNTYELADSVPMVLYMKYAKLGTQGKMTNDIEAQAVSYDMLRLSFTADAWKRFEVDAAEARASEDTLGEITAKAIQVITARPTGPLLVSSDGQQTTTQSSTASSSEPVAGKVLTFEDRKRELGLEPVTARSVEALLG